MVNAHSERGANPLMDAALGYVRDRAWRVFPLHSPTRKGGCTCGQQQCGSIGKHPRTQRGFKDASLNTPVIQAWWEEWPYANVGVATGRVSGIVTLDIDELAALAELVQRFAGGHALPDTMTIETGGGGQHRIFTHPGGDLLIPNAQRLEGIGGLDVRGDGGYIVAPPSMHASGCRYRVLNDVAPVALPEWLLALLVKAPRANVQPRRLQTLSSVPTLDEEEDACRFWLDRATARAYEGNRNATGFWLSCQLRDAGVREARAGDVLLDYATQVPGGGYTSREALGSVRQAYRSGRRDPARSQSAPSLAVSLGSSRPVTRTDGTSALRIAPVTQDTGTGDNVTQAEASPACPRFRFLSDTDVENLPPPSWLIADFLPANRLSVVYGEFGSAKSFLALDWALRIATGQPWMGHTVTQGTVAYIAGEGIGGLGKRLRAWKAHNGVSGSTGNLWLLGEPPQLLLPTDVADLRAALRTLPSLPSVVVIDTLARSLTGGDENSAQDMGMAIAAAETVQREFGSHVLLVHHKPHTASRTRGSTALPGAADTLIEVEKDGELVTVKCAKQKDWAAFDKVVLRLEVCALDDYADQTSCVLRSAEGLTRHGALTDAAQAALALLTEHPEGMCYSDMKAEWTMAPRSLFNGLTALKEQGLVKQVRGVWMLASAK